MTRGTVRCSAWLAVAGVLLWLYQSIEFSSRSSHWHRLHRNCRLLRSELCGLLYVVSKLFVVLARRIQRRAKTVYLLGKCLVFRVRLKLVEADNERLSAITKQRKMIEDQRLVVGVSDDLIDQLKDGFGIVHCSECVATANDPKLSDREGGRGPCPDGRKGGGA